MVNVDKVCLLFRDSPIRGIHGHGLECAVICVLGYMGDPGFDMWIISVRIACFFRDYNGPVLLMNCL